MSIIFFSFEMPLDGFTAGPNGGQDNPLGMNGCYQQVHVIGVESGLINI